jgi:hypothetical protein
MQFKAFKALEGIAPDSDEEDSESKNVKKGNKSPSRRAKYIKGLQDTIEILTKEKLESQ